MSEKVNIISNLSILISIFLLFLPGLGLSVEGPHLSLPDSVFNFGYVKQGATVSHTFQLCSTGDDTLKIIMIRPG